MTSRDVLSRRVVYSRLRILRLPVETVRMADGQVIDDYHQVTAGNFATIVAERGDGSILFLR